ncbi:hypothetical protein C5167_038189 [Papaver somniferum]|uniref:Uncharacterized protein n=1 Tax=Papaver somniferum TaxID=3469 RepID=A0A4Y7ICY2_PAPSO|nr:hypothetical protein C5167_038189 [Papaver somniferum]
MYLISMLGALEFFLFLRHDFRVTFL